MWVQSPHIGILITAWRKTWVSNGKQERMRCPPPPFSHRPVWWSLHKSKGLGEIDEDEPHFSYPQNQGCSQPATSRSARGCVTIQRRSLTHHPEIDHAIIYILFRDEFTELMLPPGLSAPCMLCFSSQGFCFKIKDPLPPLICSRLGDSRQPVLLQSYSSNERIE